MLIKQFNPELNGESPSTARPRVTVTLSEDVYQILSEWASQEERTLAKLLSYLAAKAARKRVERKWNGNES